MKKIISFLKSVLARKKIKEVEVVLPEYNSAVKPSAVRRPARLQRQEQVAPQVANPQATAEVKSSKKLKVNLPSLNLKVTLPSLGNISKFIVESSVRSTAKKKIESFYNNENFKAVLLSLKGDRTDENFLSIRRELKAQDTLISRFPGKILNSKKLSARKTSLEAELSKLEAELNQPARAGRGQGRLSARIAQVDSEAAAFGEITKLSK
jgi:hypothetical protein